MKQTSIPSVNFNINNLEVHFNVQHGDFRVFARPSKEYLDKLVPTHWLGMSRWDDPKSSIRICAYASKENEGCFVRADMADHWICFADNREDLVKLLEGGF